jgi:nicotinamidase-related amidase
MSAEKYYRSPLLMDPNNTAIVVIDVQDKLLPAIQNFETVQGNIERLLDAAKILEVAAVGTEQYPQGLGSTVRGIREKLPDDLPAKTMFSCRECESMFRQLADRGVQNLLLCGIETHICVAQTALDMSAAGFNVFLSLDAAGSRFAIDHEVALRRLEVSGCTLTTTEAAIFELCEQAGDDRFKAISKLVRQR